MIVVAGSANTDLVAQVDHYPEAGETILASGYAMHPGGKGANQAVAAARLAAEVRFVGAVGADEFGTRTRADLEAEGVDTRGLQQVDATSGMAFITVEDGGENRIVVVPGANSRLDEHVELEPIMQNARALLVQLETPMSFVRAALEAGRQMGAETILNAAPAAPLEALDMTTVDWLMVNAGEAAFLLGEEEGRDRQQTRDQASRLARQHELGVIATLGSDGALWVDQDGHAGHAPAHQCSVVDTTGAGDTFAGAFAAARIEDLDVAEAVHMAGAASALSVGQAGARGGMPDRKAVRRFLADDA